MKQPTIQNLKPLSPNVRLTPKKKPVTPVKYTTMDESLDSTNKPAEQPQTLQTKLQKHLVQEETPVAVDVSQLPVKPIKVFVNGEYKGYLPSTDTEVLANHVYTANGHEIDYVSADNKLVAKKVIDTTGEHLYVEPSVVPPIFGQFINDHIIALDDALREGKQVQSVELYQPPATFDPSFLLGFDTINYK